MSSKKNNNVTVNPSIPAVNTESFGGITFDTDTMLSEYTKVEKAENGTDIVSYAMEVEVIDEKIGTGTMLITDRNAIESIIGLRNSEKLEKWASYRKGAYLVQLVDSSFMVDNDIASVEKLAKMINLGIEGSSANSMESVARKLGVKFDEKGNLSFADESLPLLSFWHYNNIISLVTQNEDGSYNYDSLKDFLKVAHVTPLMSQKRIKELFNDYRNGRLENSIALPDKVSEKAQKDAKRQSEAKEKAEKAKATVSAKTAIDNAKSFMEKKAVALSALDALKDCLENIGLTDIDIDSIRLRIVETEETEG